MRQYGISEFLRKSGTEFQNLDLAAQNFFDYLDVGTKVSKQFLFLLYNKKRF